MTDPANLTSFQAATPAVTIDDLYHALLGRSVDADGTAFFSAQVQNGVTMQDVAAQIMNSQEYLQSHAQLVDTQFVGSIYQNYLHVTGDATGVDFWTASIAVEDRAPMVVDFINGAHLSAAIVPGLIGQPATDISGVV